MEILTDSHTHSAQSPDGKSTLEEMAERAAELGIRHYTVTDHLDVNDYYKPEFHYEERLRQSDLLLPKLTEAFKGRVDIHFGVELGQPLQDLELTKKLLAAHNYEFIIGSCHNIRDYEDFYFLDYKKEEPYRLLKLYFDELLEMAQWGGFDVLGHLTYPLRYISGDQGIKIDMSGFEAIIGEIFAALVKNGMGIEINTSGLRQKIGVTLPDEHYIRLYRELGGEIITVGSDAHRTEDLGKGIAEGIALAKKCGFDKIYYYDHRKPIGINI
ncbi:MAG: histidinol-phosphatase HisJ family protein [Firmicutes bacterium]|nr:histidinol-phosphatase HisJ family protein [[Eubacterium] siraeum]MCM1488796.1 histidinol-phosphatase HisJ family protein [Bacillota bacterium]